VNEFQGKQDASSPLDEYNALTFVVKQILNLISTAKVVKVISCTNSGGVSAVGFVDVMPMVNQVDGAGNAVPHTVLHNLPYMRLQGGANAVICDPQPGDIGVAVFSDRDISIVKRTKAQANPGSAAKFAMGDGIYLGMVLNAAPTQYVQFNDGGINVTDKNANTIVMDATGITINGVIFYRDHSVWSDNEITAKSSHTVSQHTHTQGKDSHGDSEAPTDPPTG
jgi:hypothetical protein